MTKPSTYMPLVIGDYMKNTMHLTTKQHGAYLLLIIHHWVQGFVPDDDRQIAAIVRLSLREWMEIRPVIAAFFNIADGRWIQARVVAELERAKGLKRRATAGGNARAAAASRGADGRMMPANDPAKHQLNDQPETSTASASASASSDIDTEINSDRPETVIAAPRKSREPAAPLPADWTPDELDAKFAVDMGLDAATIAREQTKFVAYWTAGRGAGTRRTPKGWRATWQRWTSKTAEDGIHAPGTRTNRPRNGFVDLIASGAVDEIAGRGG